LNEFWSKREEFIDTMIRPGGEFDEGFGELCSWIQSVELCGAKQGLEDGMGALGGYFSTLKQQHQYSFDG